MSSVVLPQSNKHAVAFDPNWRCCRSTTHYYRTLTCSRVYMVSRRRLAHSLLSWSWQQALLPGPPLSRTCQFNQLAWYLKSRWYVDFVDHFWSPFPAMQSIWAGNCTDHWLISIAHRKGVVCLSSDASVSLSSVASLPIPVSRSSQNHRSSGSWIFACWKPLWEYDWWCINFLRAHRISNLLYHLWSAINFWYNIICWQLVLIQSVIWR